ncbi:MAG: hypothetical protein JWQ22_809 [Devosia sp.]|nr:hypothetical protein [Devosia sp.]
MATTSDLAPERKADLAPERKPAAARVSRASTKAREAQLEDQVSQLQSDLKAIAATLARLSNDKVNEAKAVANNQVNNLQRQAEHVVEDVQERASDIEQQLKATIREKPLTAVASAIGIGFVLALLSR